MAKITCEVVNCAYNKSRKCLKSMIDVEGPFARYRDDTSCESFIEGELPSFNYEFAESEGSGLRDTEVACNVASCVFMERGKCIAEKIKIIGRNAKESHETDCETFHCR
ncbi:MAG: DUF1540 domain-containing protein [Bacilli bacterium]|jgi:hypothetical protein|nr:DUF1540 domain-containing protein [Acholeplasmataceae bacterium]